MSPGSSNGVGHYEVMSPPKKMARLTGSISTLFWQSSSKGKDMNCLAAVPTNNDNDNDNAVIGEQANLPTTAKAANESSLLSPQMQICISCSKEECE